jgi:hypothetical protein
MLPKPNERSSGRLGVAYDGVVEVVKRLLDVARERFQVQHERAVWHEAFPFPFPPDHVTARPSIDPAKFSKTP